MVRKQCAPDHRPGDTLAACRAELHGAEGEENKKRAWLAQVGEKRLGSNSESGWALSVMYLPRGSCDDENRRGPHSFNCCAHA